MRSEICHGDITGLSVDTIVNAANNSLMGGGGVDGAIHRAAGPQLLEACLEIRKSVYPDGLPIGKAVITKGYDLPAEYVIHTVGPIYDNQPPEQSDILLGDAYRNSLQVAESNLLSSIAFPAISTGIFGFPKDRALGVVKRVIDNFPFQNIDNLILCYFSQEEKEMAQDFFK